jgi:hypothetical protein
MAFNLVALLDEDLNYLKLQASSRNVRFLQKKTQKCQTQEGLRQGRATQSDYLRIWIFQFGHDFIKQVVAKHTRAVTCHTRGKGGSVPA